MADIQVHTYKNIAGSMDFESPWDLRTKEEIECQRVVGVLRAAIPDISVFYMPRGIIAVRAGRDGGALNDLVLLPGDTFEIDGIDVRRHA